jgi:predicted nucleic acid-binding protein
MNENIYFDTSALAKWYLNETRSEEVEKYIQEHGPVGISDLTVVEMRSLLSRRRREKSINLSLELQIFAAFQEDIRKKFLICHPLPSGFAWGAVNLISILTDVPLRTLDALHLLVAKESGADFLATADRIMATGAKLLGLSVVRFD